MTYLELSQALRSLSGTTGEGPLAVTGLTGIYLRTVTWVKDAWVKIQKEHKGEWDFLWTEWTRDTVASTRDYEVYTADGISSFDDETFYYFLTADGSNERKPLNYVEYKDFIHRYTDWSQDGEPEAITILPNRSVRIYPEPDDIYTIEATAFIKPQVLAADGDIPLVQDDLHMMIVYRALMDYGGYEETDSTYQYAKDEYDRLFSEMLWQHKYEEEQMVVRPQ